MSERKKLDVLYSSFDNYPLKDRLLNDIRTFGIYEKLKSIKEQLPLCDVLVVGGAVRDLVNHLAPHDIDFVACVKEGHSIEEVTQDLKVVGKNHPVALIDHSEVTITDSAINDAYERDFTVNALLLGMSSPDVFYIYGVKGVREDFEQHILRSHGNIVGKLRKDPIRILRALRFAAKYNLQIDNDLHFALHHNRHLVMSGSVPTIRIQEELRKGISCKNGYRYVQLLDEYELLSSIFPALYAVKGVDGAHYHNETVYTHCINALRALDKLNLPDYVKMAALYHDVGKIRHEVSEEGKVRFTNHAKLSRNLVVSDLSRLGFPKDFINRTSTLVREHMNMVGGKKSLMKLIMKLNKGNVTYKEFVWHKYADSLSNMKSKTDFNFFRNMYKDGLRVINPKHVPSLKDLVISGKDIMSELEVPQGKMVGQILNTLWEYYLNGEIENNREALLQQGNLIRLKLITK